jgi:hypothetical protein
MVRRIDNNGLVLSLVKLNGKLELHFTVDATFTAQYTIHGTDLEDTVEMEYAREAATGQPVVSIGLEMFMEDVGGLLEVRFDGAIGSSLSFRYDGRDSGDIHTFDGPLAIEPPATLGCLQAQPSSDALLVGTQYFQRVTTRDAKSQTIEQETRNVKTQTVGTPVQHAGVQTKTRRVVNRSTQATSKTTAPKEEARLFPTVVDLTEQNISSPSPSRAHHALSRTTPEVAPTFTNAVATVFQTFNEPRDPYRQKRQAEPAADYRAYKHIFIEGYRNGDGKEEEGRLHVDLAHHVLLWESYDDYEGGAKLTLDRFDLPRCKSPIHPGF